MENKERGCRRCALTNCQRLPASFNPLLQGREGAVRSRSESHAERPLTRDGSFRCVHIFLLQGRAPGGANSSRSRLLARDERRPFCASSASSETARRSMRARANAHAPLAFWRPRAVFRSGQASGISKRPRAVLRRTRRSRDFSPKACSRRPLAHSFSVSFFSFTQFLREAKFVSQELSTFQDPRLCSATRCVSSPASPDFFPNPDHGSGHSVDSCRRSSGASALLKLCESSAARSESPVHGSSSAKRHASLRCSSRPRQSRTPPPFGCTEVARTSSQCFGPVCGDAGIVSAPIVVTSARSWPRGARSWSSVGARGPHLTRFAPFACRCVECRRRATWGLFPVSTRRDKRSCCGEDSLAGRNGLHGHQAEE